MDIPELLGNARDTLTVKRVYGEPYERDGMVVIPAATVRGGLGGGTMAGAGEAGRMGGGFGMEARPIGVFLLRDGGLHWRPAVDVNRLLRVAVLGLAIFGSVAVRLFGPRRRVFALQRRSPRRSARAFFAR